LKKIGMIGGMSWESSLEYYRLVNELVKEKLGGYHSAKVIMVSLDFAEVELLQHEGRWQEAGKMMADSALTLQTSGADFVVLCTNTMHKCTPEIEAAIQIPFLHIVDPTAEAICKMGIKTIGLLGTRFTMEEDFYKGRLKDKYGLYVIIPSTADQEKIHQVIFQELVLGKINTDSRKDYLDIINNLIQNGAEGIILGCTEIGLLINPDDVHVPVFDTTILHARAAVDFAFQPS
jgi:aspartate racemase